MRVSTPGEPGRGRAGNNAYFLEVPTLGSGVLTRKQQTPPVVYSMQLGISVESGRTALSKPAPLRLAPVA